MFLVKNNEEQNNRSTTIKTKTTLGQSSTNMASQVPIVKPLDLKMLEKGNHGRQSNHNANRTDYLTNDLKSGVKS